MVCRIRRYDPSASITVVDGFMHKALETQIQGVPECREAVYRGRGVTFVRNPFYAVTNSIASLWFVLGLLLKDDVTIINGGIVMEDALMKTVVCKASLPRILLDSHNKI